MLVHATELKNHVAPILSTPQGVETTLIFDSYTPLTGGEGFRVAANYPGFLRPISKDARQIQRNRQEFARLVQTLEDKGTTVKITNPPKRGLFGFAKRWFPLIGTNHIKGSHVDNRVFYMHTNNFEPQDNPDHRKADIMLKLGGQAAEKMTAEFKKINSENPPQEDYRVQIEEDLELYVDSGQKGKSIILDKAKELIASTKESIQNCSVFLPDGDIAKLLASAHKDSKKVEVITSGLRPKLTGLSFYTINNIFYAFNTAAHLLQKLKGIRYPKIYDKNRVMHAKLLIVDGKPHF